MGYTRSHLISLLLYISVINEIRLPTVTCQDEEGNQCIPKKTFFALLRLPEVSSNLAAYSRTARLIHDAKNRNDMVHLRTLNNNNNNNNNNNEESEDAEICLPAGVYLELFGNPAMRGHMSAIGRAQKLLEYSTPQPLDDLEGDKGSEKRSLATLAKNDDLPTSIQGRNEEDDEEKRSLNTGYEPMSDEGATAALIRALIDEERMRKNAEMLREYAVPIADLDLGYVDSRDAEDYKRSVASLARDSSLPYGKRNVAALARDFALPSGKRNVGSLARDWMLPQGGGKRNVASLARDYALPYGKRYLGALARSGGLSFYDDADEKRSVSSLARNSGFPSFAKRNVGTLARDWSLPSQSRHGRSLEDKQLEPSEPLVLQRLGSEDAEFDRNVQDERYRRLEAERKRMKRQVDFSEEYPVPVLQNSNVLDYEELIEALTGRYPNTEKRFMGRIPQMGPRPTTPPTRRLGR